MEEIQAAAVDCNVFSECCKIQMNESQTVCCNRSGGCSINSVNASLAKTNKSHLGKRQFRLKPQAVPLTFPSIYRQR